MNDRISKAQYRRPRVRLSKCLQQQLLDALALPSSPVADDSLPQDLPVRSTKRQLDEIDPPPAKRARLANTQPPEEPADKTPVLHHPKPTSSTRYTTFLERFVDPTPAPRANSEHSFVLEWLKSVWSDRDIRCRSDSHLHPSDDSPIPRQLTKSAPEMGYLKDADGYAVPAMPASTGSASHNRSVAPSDATTSSTRSSRKSLVEDPNYRNLNLYANHIHMQPWSEQFPQHITDTIRRIQRDRDSPGPSPEEIRQDRDLYRIWTGGNEDEVAEYFKGRIFPSSGSTSCLERHVKARMLERAAPSSYHLKVSTPVPDIIYGYNTQLAFSQQRTQLMSMGSEPMANNQREVSLYPFFSIEFKGDGGSMWVATNQCIGASASCVNVAETLNRRLRQCESSPIDSAAFSIAMNGSEARLHISWKQSELDYYMTTVKTFSLFDPEHYIDFRRHVLNIVDWGESTRLEQIRDGLETLLEESRKGASAEAKSRTPPSSDAASSSSSSSKSRKIS